MKKLNIASLWMIYLKPFIIIFGNIIGVAFFISASIDQSIPSFLKLIGIIMLSVNLLCIPWRKQGSSEIDVYRLTKKFPNITEAEFLFIKNSKRKDVLKSFLESFDEQNKNDLKYIEAKKIYIELLKEKKNIIKENRGEKETAIYDDFQTQKEKSDPFRSRSAISPDPTLDNK